MRVKYHMNHEVFDQYDLFIIDSKIIYVIPFPLILSFLILSNRKCNSTFFIEEP